MSGLIGTIGRFCTDRKAPPLLRGHYAEIQDEGYNDRKEQWEYSVSAHTWIWGPKLVVAQDMLTSVPADVAARVEFITQQSKTLTPGGVTDSSLDQAIEAFGDAFVRFAEAAEVPKEKMLREGFQNIWLAYNAYEALEACGIQERPDEQGALLAAWEQLITASQRVAEITERVVTGD